MFVQLTGTPDGGCLVEHRLKVQPVLDAPALFSELTSCTPDGLTQACGLVPVLYPVHVLCTSGFIIIRGQACPHL